MHAENCMQQDGTPPVVLPACRLVVATTHASEHKEQARYVPHLQVARSTAPDCLGSWLCSQAQLLTRATISYNSAKPLSQHSSGGPECTLLLAWRILSCCCAGLLLKPLQRPGG